ncbi:MAG: insulinase family protein [candidate division Zixibacteria bacterium]|nr:insulinase family protein [candidate division Zixibacteria bacterium]
MKNSMIIIIAAITICSLVIGTATGLAQDIDKLEFPPLSKLKIPKVEKVTLDNGIRLYLIEDRSLPTFEASIRVNCGGYLEPIEKIGLAGICGTVMRTGGTSKWSGDELDELLEGIGGSVESSIGNLSGGASISVLSDYTDLGLEVLAEVLRRPVFNEDKIELAKIQARTGISRRNDEPFPIIVREFRKLIYGADSPYGRHTEYATLNAISRDDLIEFHKTFYHPQNVQISIWGDFKKKDVVKKIKKYFGDWLKTRMEVPPPPKVDYKFENQVYYVEKKDLPQSYIFLGHIGGYVLDDDYADRIVMNSILGESFGSRLMDNVRTKEGLAYATGGRYSAHIEYPGIFYAYASTKSASTVKAIREMVKQIKSMHTDPPTAIEMRKGKDGFLNSFVFNFDSKSEVVGRLMNYDFHGLPEDLIFKQKEGVEKVTGDDVVAAAMKNLKPDALRIVVLGNAEDFDFPLTELGMGDIVEVDITIPSGEEKTDLAITPENIDKGKQLIAKAVNAHGGLDNFKKINSISRKRTFALTTPQGEFSFTVESLEVLPDKSRAIINMMGREMYDIRNGDSGWKSNQMGELVAKTDEDIQGDIKKMARNNLTIFKTSDNPAYQAVYDGNGKVDGVQVEYATLLDEAGETICRIGFNSDDGSLISKSYWGESPLGEGTIEETFDNFSEIEGVRLPMIVNQSLNGQHILKTEVTEFIINPEIPDNAFDKP